MFRLNDLLWYKIIDYNGIAMHAYSDSLDLICGLFMLSI